MRRVSKNVEQGVAVKETGTIDVEMPETCKYLLSARIKLFGGAPLTITSGTVAFKKGSVIGSAFSSVNFKRGTVNIKAGGGEMFRFFDMCVKKEKPKLNNSAGASLVLHPQTELAGYASPSVGTTGQYFNVWEELTLHFENVFAATMGGRLKTAINTVENGATKKYLLQLGCQDLESAMLGVGNTSVISFTDLSNLKVAVDIDEMEEDQPDEILSQFPEVADRETFYQIQEQAKITPSQNGKVLRNIMTDSGKLHAITTLVIDNAAGAAGAASGKQRNDALITAIAFSVDDKAPLGEFQSYYDCKTALRNKFNYKAPEANGVSEETGFAGLVLAVPALIGTSNRVCIKYSSAAQATATDYGTSVTADLNYMAHYVGKNVAKSA